MRKSLINQTVVEASGSEYQWLELARLASVEVSSEDKSFPIESALTPGEQSGWRASGSGKQVIRLLFDEPQQIKIIKLLFVEHEKARTQEYLLRWSQNNGPNTEILRQQFNFSPPDIVRETEVHAVNLEDVTALELSIIPETGGGGAYASLASLKLA